MDNKLFIFLTVLVLIGSMVALVVEQTGKYYEDQEYTWRAETLSTNGNLLIRGKKIDKIKNDITKLMNALNRSKDNPETFRTPQGKEPINPPKLKLLGIQGQTANVEVINDEYLTERMGSHGAEEFLAVATFTLTEYDKIESVKFDFKKGAHAEPGIYTRDSFLKNWQVISK